MNPIFWLLVILVLVCLWFSATFMFKGLGGFLGKIFYDTFRNDSKENRKRGGKRKCVKV